MNKDNKPWHFGQRWAGQTLEWLPSDEKRFFDQNMKNSQFAEFIKQQGWDQPGSIIYKINSEGFRSEEFETDASCMIALGCSFTVGIGLPIETIWPTLLGKQLNLKVYNLGWGGTSADTCYRLARYWIPQLRPKLVAMLAPPRDRIELLLDQGNQPPTEVFLPNSQSKYFNGNDIFLKHWWLNEQNGKINSEKNLLAVKQLAQMHDATFVGLRADEEMSRSREEVDFARDYMHAGPRGHELVTEKMLKELSWP